MMQSTLVPLVLLMVGSPGWAAVAGDMAAAPSLGPYNVVWQTPSEDSKGSMPLGNGDIGANVWVQNGGDLMFYISKTDAWGDDVPGNYGLPKVGRVRVKLTPNPFEKGEPFRQTLDLESGAIEIEAGGETDRVKIKMWVDANAPVIHLQTSSARPVNEEISFDQYRDKPTDDLNADNIFPGQKNRVAWCYRNRSKLPALKNLTFGAVIEGNGLVNRDERTLGAASSGREFDAAIYVDTAQALTADAWLADIDHKIETAKKTDLTAAWQKHADWWRNFWSRSWVIVQGDAAARTVTQGDLLQRFTCACAGRGAYPIKFNGSLFTTDNVASFEDAHGKKITERVNGDFRVWGGCYWFQNTRHLYWPMLEAGDFDMMRPLFGMYQRMLMNNKKAVRQLYHHGGSYIAETSPFYGGLRRVTADTPGSYTIHYYTPVLEFSAMLLDYYAYTGDRNFARQTLLPVANDGVTFFDEHFRRDDKGKLLLSPDNAIETYWKVRDPMPDIAGLRYVLTGLLALPPDLADQSMRDRWKRILDEVPELPTAVKDGHRVLVPFEAFNQDTGIHNSENPELYAIFPFRLFGLGRPELRLARDTFAVRRFKSTGCWHPDAIQAAYLGDAKLAARDVLANFTPNQEFRFPAFWKEGDYIPDEDNGGVAQNALQLMILQPVGNRLLLLPAWPKQWSGSFKLHAPGQTTISGTIKSGTIENLAVKPARRRRDVEIRRSDGSFAPLSN